MSSVRRDAAARVLDAKRRLGLSWQQLADALDAELVPAVNALLGRGWMTPERAAAAAALLEDPALEADLQVHPDRTDDPADHSDPFVYRLHEMVQVSGPAVREIVLDQLGDGIVSAIDFKLGVELKEVDGVKRVVMTLNGKFLPYSSW